MHRECLKFSPNKPIPKLKKSCGRFWGIFMESKKRFIIATLGILPLAISISCAPANQSSDAPRREAIADGTGSDGTGTDTPTRRERNRDSSENRAAAALFFDEKVQPVFRNTAIPRCIECHDAPRNTLGNPDAGGLTIYEFSNMYALLKDGPYPNENELINILLGNRVHPGARICRTEQDATCALIVEWWNVAFGASSGGAAKLGEIQGVSARGQVSGWALDPKDDSVIYKVRVYIDGDKDEGTFLGEVNANTNTQINGLQRPRGFVLKIPDAMIANNERVVHAYVVKDGVEVEISASPFKFTAYAPKGLNVVGNAFPNNALGCGCHSWSYETLYGALLSPPPRDGGTGFNNELWRRMSATAQGGVTPLPHPGAANSGAIANAVPGWWQAEFGN